MFGFHLARFDSYPIYLQVHNGAMISTPLFDGTMSTIYSLSIGANADGIIGLDNRMDKSPFTNAF